MDLALNNLQRLICNKTQTTKTKPPNECPGYDTRQSDGEVPAVLEYPIIAIAPSSTLARSGSTDRALSLG